jgi:hypothetical protein
MKPLPILEPAPVPEPFATDVARVEIVGPCVRAILGARQVSFLDGSQEIIISARVVMTPECAVHLARALLAAVAVQTKAEPDAAGAACRVVN